METSDGFGLQPNTNPLYMPLKDKKKEISMIRFDKQTLPRPQVIIPGATLSNFKLQQQTNIKLASPGQRALHWQHSHHYDKNKKRTFGLDSLAQIPQQPNKKRAFDPNRTNSAFNKSSQNESQSNANSGSNKSSQNESQCCSIDSMIDKSIASIESNSSSNHNNNDIVSTIATDSNSIDFLFDTPVNPYIGSVHASSSNNGRMTLIALENRSNIHNKGSRVSNGCTLLNTSVKAQGRTNASNTDKPILATPVGKTKAPRMPTNREMESFKNHKDRSVKTLKKQHVKQQSGDSSTHAPKIAATRITSGKKRNKKNPDDDATKSESPPQDEAREAFKKSFYKNVVSNTTTRSSLRRYGSTYGHSSVAEISVVDLVSDDDDDNVNAVLNAQAAAGKKLNALKNGNLFNDQNNIINHKRNYCMVSLGYIGNINMNSFFSIHADLTFSTFVSAIDESCVKIGWLGKYVKDSKSRREQHWLINILNADIKRVYHGCIRDAVFLIVELVETRNIISVGVNDQSDSLNLGKDKDSIILISKFASSFNEMIADLYKYLEEDQINDCRISSMESVEVLLQAFLLDNGYEKLSEISIDKAEFTWFGYDLSSPPTDSFPTGRQRGPRRADDRHAFLVYPIDDNASFPITISNGDMRRLEPRNMLNDTLIDFGFKRLLQNRLTATESNNSVYAFTNFFFTKLSEKRDAKEAHALVAKWTKNIDIFSLHYVLFPINFDEHWSLTVLVKPYLLLPYFQSLAKNSTIGQHGTNSYDDFCESGFLLMDSLNIHYTNNKVTDILRNYLFEEYVEKYVRGGCNSNNINILPDSAAANGRNVDDVQNCDNKLDIGDISINSADVAMRTADATGVAATATAVIATATLANDGPSSQHLLETLREAFLDKLPAVKVRNIKSTLLFSLYYNTSCAIVQCVQAGKWHRLWYVHYQIRRYAAPNRR